MPSRPFRRALIALLVLAAATVLVLPFLSADRFRDSLRGELETLLQRPVELGEVHFTLWGGPGFHVRNLTVASDPGDSVEPLAYVDRARLHLRLSSLWSRTWMLSRITLIQPSFNIAQAAEGGWNLQSLVPRAMRDRLSAGEPLPTLVVDAGRINFRQGLRKSVYYFRNANLQLAEEGIGTGAWLLDFRAEPARTDSAAPRFGTVRGSGRWRALVAPDGELDMDVELERSPLAELAALMGLPQAGLSGYVTARAHLSGPATSLSLRGNLELRDFSDWTILPGKSAERGLPLEGMLNLPARHLRLQAAGRAEQPLPYSASLEMFPPEDPGSWQAAIRFQETPVATIAELLQYLDDSIPRYPALTGTLGGEIRYHSQTGLLGALESPQLTWNADSPENPDTSRFDLLDFKVQLTGDEFQGTASLQPGSPADSTREAQSGPGPLPGAGSEPGTSPKPDNGQETGPPSEAASWDFLVNRRTGALELRLKGSQLKHEHLQAQASLAPVASPHHQLLSDPSWRAKGTVSWRRSGFRSAGLWYGALDASDLRGPLPGLGVPYHFTSASLDLRGESWQIRNAQGTLGNARFQVNLRSDPRTDPPFSGTFRAKSVLLEDLDPWFVASPADQEGFLTRAFRRRSSPALASRTKERLRAQIYIEKVLINSSTYSDLRADLHHHGNSIEIQNVSFESRFGLCRGLAVARQHLGALEWRLNLAGRHESWQDGVLEFSLERMARGKLSAIAGSAAGAAQVDWQGPDQLQPSRLAVLHAELEWKPDQPEPTICEYCLELRNADGVWLGSCNQSNGTGYRCPLQDPRTGQQLELELPMSMVGSHEN